MNRIALAFIASLVLLCSAFAATPWKQMTYGAIDGYGDVDSHERITDNRESRG
jgi:hypothetical protein